MSAIASDPYEARRATGATGLLREFNDIGVLSAADVHVAARLAELVSEETESVRLAVALAVRGPRLGNVFVDLATIRDTATVDSDEPVDLSELQWPRVDEWLRALSGSELVAVGEDDVDPAGAKPRLRAGGAGGVRGAKPLRLLGTRLLPRPLLARGARGRRRPERADRERPAAGDRRRPRDREDDASRSDRRGADRGGHCIGSQPNPAAAHRAGRADRQGRGPTQEAVHEETARLPVSDSVRELVMGLRASTLHRLLGWRPGSHSRFAHDRGNRLPHDVVIVDETSMVSLSLMARLTEAVRPDARLILVGDPGQLTSIEAGVVLGDIVGNDPGSAAWRRGHRRARPSSPVRRRDRRGSPTRSVPVTATVPWRR